MASKRKKRNRRGLKEGGNSLVRVRGWTRGEAFAGVAVVLALLAVAWGVFRWVTSVEMMQGQKANTESVEAVDDRINDVDDRINDIGIMAEWNRANVAKIWPNVERHTVLRLHNVEMKFDAEGKMLFDNDRSRYTAHFYAHKDARFDFWYHYQCIRGNDTFFIKLPVVWVEINGDRICQISGGRAKVECGEDVDLSKLKEFRIGDSQRNVYNLTIEGPLSQWGKPDPGDTDHHEPRLQPVDYCQFDLVVYARLPVSPLAGPVDSQ